MDGEEGIDYTISKEQDPRLINQKAVKDGFRA